jgi:signal transduction histidine kinase
VADLRRTSIRLGVALALAVVGLFEVLSLLQGVRSVRRLRARVAHEAQERAEASRPAIEAALAPGGPWSWDGAARVALSLGLASEVEILDANGDSVFSRPTVAPVVHRPGAAERRLLAGRRAASVVVQQGEAVRALVYLPLASAGGGVLRLASPAPDLQDELRERQQVFLGHLASLAALTLAVALVLLPREADSPPPPSGALHAYEQAMERLRDRGEEMTARHAAERRRMEEAILEKDALARAGELTAGIVHEVRNGLATIVGYARMLERAGLVENEAAAASAIRAECDTLEIVVRRFSDFVKLERMQPGETDLARLLGRVVAREQRGHEGVRTRLVGLDAPLLLRADEELLERAFENVVRNAIEAAAAGGGTVEVTAEASEGRVEVRIEDDGPGLPPDHPGEIRPFYTTRPGGLGLGLPLARKIVLLHGGTLTLEDRDPSGVRAVIRLPVAALEI